MTVSPQTARETWRALEPVHAMIYFAPDPQEEYQALGLDSKANRAIGYFPARAAAMGAVSDAVVQATFFNFSALAVAFGMANAWDTASPAMPPPCGNDARCPRLPAGDPGKAYPVGHPSSATPARSEPTPDQ